MGTGTMKCVKLGGLQYASKLLLELSNVKCKINSVPKIKPTIKASGRKNKNKKHKTKHYRMLQNFQLKIIL